MSAVSRTFPSSVEPSRKNGASADPAVLLRSVPALRILGTLPAAVTGIACDSRQCGPGDVFAALRGDRSDGHSFIADAIRAGASMVLSERAPEDLGIEAGGCAFVVCEDTLRSLGHLAAAFYGNPAEELRFIGVTGSNGKTTTVYLLEHILLHEGHCAGAITTVEDRWPGHAEKAAFTTPQSHILQRLLREMRNAGVTHAVSEVSSHALKLHRMIGIEAEVAVFTNLSFEHREFHPDQEDYYQAKKRLFTLHLKRTGVACLNLDDACGMRLSLELEGEGRSVLTYGCTGSSMVRAEDASLSPDGTDLTLCTPAGRRRLRSPLVGRFNISNVLAATSAALAAGLSLDRIVEAVGSFRGVPGRMEKIDAGQDFSLYVDYAHSPDAMENVLATIREFAPRRVITVFGAGGNRSREKRAPMGSAAAKYSDLVVLTADNSRWESTTDIINDIKKGMVGHEHKILVEEDRRKAILEAVRRARTADIIVLSGKGHESSQCEQGATRPFDDRVESRRALSQVLAEQRH